MAERVLQRFRALDDPCPHCGAPRMPPVAPDSLATARACQACGHVEELKSVPAAGDTRLHKFGMCRDPFHIHQAPQCCYADCWCLEPPPPCDVCRREAGTLSRSSLRVDTFCPKHRREFEEAMDRSNAALPALPPRYVKGHASH